MHDDILRIEIDGQWTAQQFSDFYEGLQALSFHWIADMEYRFAPPKRREQSLARLRMGNATLSVKRISFASPGFTDLAGFGAILSELRQLLVYLIDKLIEREDRKLERDAKRLEIMETKLRIVNMMQTSELPQSVTKLMECDEIENLIEAIQDGRIKGVSLIEQEFE